MRDCKLAALEAEARTAKALALKAAKAAENYRDKLPWTASLRPKPTARNLWPSRRTVNQASPRSRAARGTTGCLRGNKEYVEQLKTLM